jgi:hypothetical protein
MNKIANTKLILIFLILFSVFGLAKSSQAATATGPLRVLSSNPRYFTDGSGKAIYLTGSHTWTNLKDMGTSNSPPVFDYNAYLDFLTQSKHNFIRLWTWELTRFQFSGKSTAYTSPFPWPRTGSTNALDGKPKFNLSTFDQPYFDRLRSRVIAARDREIYVSIMLFEGNGANISTVPWRWNGHPFNASNNINGINGDVNGNGTGIEVHTLQNSAVTAIQEAYVRKLIDTVNDLDNVLYEITNEAGAYSTEWQYYMINYVKNYEKTKPKQHPVGMTFQYPDGNNDALFSSPADWISPNPLASSPYDYKTNPPPANGSKVVFPDTDHLWGVGGNRTWVWKSFLRGYNPIYMDPLSVITGVNALTNVFSGSEPADITNTRKTMGYTLTYAQKMNLAAMTPQNSLSSTAYCLAKSGSEYLVYQPSSNTSFTVNLVAGNYSFEWFNPATGVVASSGTVAASGGNKSFTSPFSGDAVLYLKISSSDTTAPAPPTGVTIQ